MQMSSEFTPKRRLIEFEHEEIQPNDENYQSKRKLKSDKFSEKDWEPEKQVKSEPNADLNAIIKRFEDAGERPPAALLRSRPITYEEAVARMRGESFESPEEVQESLEREMGDLTEHQRRILDRIRQHENAGSSIDYAEIEERAAAANLVCEDGSRLTQDSLRDALEEIRAQERISRQAAEIGRTLSGMGIQASQATRSLSRAFANLGEAMNQQMGRAFRPNGTLSGRFSSREVNIQSIPRNDMLDSLAYSVFGRERERDRTIPRDPVRFLGDCRWSFDRAVLEDMVHILLHHSPSESSYRFEVVGREFNTNAAMSTPQGLFREYPGPVEEFQSQLADRFGWRETRAERRGNSFRDQCDIRTIEHESSDSLQFEITHRATGRKQSGSVSTMQLGRARDPDSLIRTTIDNLLRELEDRVARLGGRRGR